MAKRMKSVRKHAGLRNFLLQTISNIDCLKYRTLTKSIETVKYYGYPDIYTYGTGVYLLNNGVKLTYNYVYIMDCTQIKTVIDFACTVG
jgi:hypothetical protein